MKCLARPALVAALVLQSAAACSVFRGDSGKTSGTDSTKPPPDVSAAETFATDIAIPVEAATVVRDTLVVSVSAAAQAAAQSEARLLAQVAGRIVAVHVRENESVGGGELLLEIDTTEYALGLARARAAFARAQASFRELTLFDDQITDTASYRLAVRRRPSVRISARRFESSITANVRL